MMLDLDLFPRWCISDVQDMASSFLTSILHTAAVCLLGNLPHMPILKSRTNVSARPIASGVAMMIDAADDDDVLLLVLDCCCCCCGGRGGRG